MPPVRLRGDGRKAKNPKKTILRLLSYMRQYRIRLVFVVLCILLFNTPAATYIDYAMNRIFDTAVGVLLALFVSYVFPRGWREMWPERYQGMKQHAREAFSHVHIHHPPRKKRFRNRS